MKDKKVSKAKPNMYKGYDVYWLKRDPKHPDYKLVAEYEKKYGEIK